ncbi:putative ferric-chelate reductase 1 [Dysidea avara]|uniref:putative ferric-chelate reductase 1 n=1 Tax=Dysidea avara TaxID=196820 RepID=UPI0033241A04
MDFKGFMIQGRARSDDSPVGSFDATGRTDYQPQCSGDTAATHTSRAEKTSVDLTWKAPTAGTGEVCFRFAFVDHFTLFWDNLMTRCLKEATSVIVNGSSSTSGDTATITLSANVKGTWQCSLDVGPFELCHMYSGLSAGTHTINARFSPSGLPQTASKQFNVTFADFTPFPTVI